MPTDEKKKDRCIYGDDSRYPGNKIKAAKNPTTGQMAEVEDENEDLKKQLAASKNREAALAKQLEAADQEIDHDKRHDTADGVGGEEKTASREAAKLLKKHGIEIEAVNAGADNKVGITEARAHIAQAEATGNNNGGDDSRGLDSQG